MMPNPIRVDGWIHDPVFEYEWAGMLSARYRNQLTQALFFPLLLIAEPAFRDVDTRVSDDQFGRGRPS